MGDSPRTLRIPPGACNNSFHQHFHYQQHHFFFHILPTNSHIYSNTINHYNSSIFTSSNTTSTSFPPFPQKRTYIFTIFKKNTKLWRPKKNTPLPPGKALQKLSQPSLDHHTAKKRRLLLPQNLLPKIHHASQSPPPPYTPH